MKTVKGQGRHPGGMKGKAFQIHEAASAENRGIPGGQCACLLWALLWKQALSVEGFAQMWNDMGLMYTPAGHAGC